MTNEEYGALIRALRKTAGLTQKELGMACGVDEANASRKVRAWERGEYLPTLRHVRPLARALHCSIDTLLL